MNINKENVKKWIAVMRDPEVRQNVEGLYIGSDGSMCTYGCLYKAMRTDPFQAPLQQLLEVSELEELKQLQYDGCDTLIFSLNDSLRLTLPQIADLVEQQFLNS